MTMLSAMAACLPLARQSGAANSSSQAKVVRCEAWPDWISFKNTFIQADGRVIDFSANAQSTSEGQAYSLFFALIANDREAFDKILTWTRTNLADGDFAGRLMAWQWGQRKDGNWGILDNNSASDADLWLTYVLFQAARIWKDPVLRATALLVEARIEKELILHVDDVGFVLLPGAKGFDLKSGGWKLNPSYLPLPVLHGLALEVPTGPWQALIKTTVSMFESVTPQQLVPDWVAVRPGKGFLLDMETGLVGGYDAIRAYLWAALMPAGDPNRKRLLSCMKGMRSLLEQQLVPPEKINALSGEVRGTGPVGFSAALLPFLEIEKAGNAASQQRRRILAAGGIPEVYYEQVLGLFASGWQEKRYRFELDGRVHVANRAACKI